MTSKEYNNCVKLYADRVYRFIIKHVKQEADAKDLVQNAYLVLWNKHADIEVDKARAFLFSVAYNKMVDGFRKMKRVQHWADMPEDSRIVYPTSNDLKEVLDKGLETLPEIQKTVVLLRDYEGYAYQEIAEITQLSEAQVKVYIFRARKKLRFFLSGLVNSD
ncbi:MAG: RNA polymerase sigma factor [Chitinophagales bacterium]